MKILDFLKHDKKDVERQEMRHIEKEIVQPDPDNPMAPMINNAMKYAEMLGIDKREIGKTILKAVITGKLDYKEPKQHRSPFEKTMQTIYDGWFLWILLFIFYMVIKYTTYIWR